MLIKTIVIGKEFIVSFIVYLFKIPSPSEFDSFCCDVGVEILHLGDPQACQKN